MKTAMILAAGRGERLRPITNYIPKAMCLVQGKPLIEHHVENLANAGFTKLVINHAYLGAKIRQHLGSGEKWGLTIHYLAEPPGGLETGGGLYNALPLFDGKPFLTINADIYTDYPLNQLILEEDALVKLVLVNNPANYQGDFTLIDNRISLSKKSHTYAGIAVYHPKVFDKQTIGRYSVTPLLKELINRELVLGEIYEGKWIDIGSIRYLKLANEPGI